MEEHILKGLVSIIVYRKGKWSKKKIIEN